MEDVFTTHPYSHILDADFEKRFTVQFLIALYSTLTEKEEIEKEYQKGHLGDLRRASRVAYENRVPKTEKETDGLLGELTLDSFIKLFFPDIEMLYSRCKIFGKKTASRRIC